MDYSLGALKLLCIQLKNAREAPSQKAFTLGGILFQRAWLQLEAELQGVLVSTPSSSDSGGGGFHLDDGTGVIELLLFGDFRSRNWETGMYVMVVGFYSVRDDGTFGVKGRLRDRKRWVRVGVRRCSLRTFLHLMAQDGGHGKRTFYQTIYSFLSREQRLAKSLKKKISLAASFKLKFLLEFVFSH